MEEIINKDMGYVPLWRSLQHWEWYSDNNMRGLFIHLLLMAGYKSKMHFGTLVPIGAYLTSIQALSEETGISPRSIRTCLSRMKKDGLIEITPTRKPTRKLTRGGSIISICNYERYILKRDIADTQTDTQTDIQTTRKRHASDTQATHTNKEYNDEIENETILNNIAIHFFENGSNAKETLIEAARNWGIADEVISRFIELGIGNMNHRNGYALCDNKGEIIRDVKAALLAFAKRHNKSYRPDFENVLIFAGKKGISRDVAKEWYDEMEGNGWKNYQGQPMKNWQRSLTRHIESHKN